MNAKEKAIAVCDATLIARHIDDDVFKVGWYTDRLYETGVGSRVDDEGLFFWADTGYGDCDNPCWAWENKPYSKGLMHAFHKELASVLSKGIDIYVGVPNVSGAFIYAQYSLLIESASDQNTVCLNGKYAKDGKPLGYLAWRGISEICAKYDGTEMVEVAWCKFAPNPKFLDELKREINPIVRKQFESCDGKMKRLLAKQG